VSHSLEDPTSSSPHALAPFCPQRPGGETWWRGEAHRVELVLRTATGIWTHGRGADSARGGVDHPFSPQRTLLVALEQDGRRETQVPRVLFLRLGSVSGVARVRGSSARVDPAYRRFWALVSGGARCGWVESLPI
jgi:hypothetical protein